MNVEKIRTFPPSAAREDWLPLHQTSNLEHQTSAVPPLNLSSARPPAREGFRSSLGEGGCPTPPSSFTSLLPASFGISPLLHKPRHLLRDRTNETTASATARHRT